MSFPSASFATDGQPISVVIVSYHTGEALFASVRSVLRQGVPLEVIVVDNGNPAGTIEELQAVAAKDGRVRIITGHGNIGFGRANNKGVAASKGEYILILNPDCELADDVLDKLRRYAATLSRPFMIGARILNKDGSDQRGCRRELLTPLTALVEAFHLGRIFPRYRLNKHEEEIPRSLTPVPALSGAFMFLPRADYDRIGGFDEGYFLHVEDLDFCLRFRRARGEIYFAPDIEATHIGGTSATASDFIERHKARGFVRYFHNNFRDEYPGAFLWLLDIAIWMRYFLRRCFSCGKRKPCRLH